MNLTQTLRPSELGLLSKGLVIKDSMIWIEDSLAIGLNLNSEVYNDAIMKGLKKINTCHGDEEKIFIKLRPGQSEEDSNIAKVLQRCDLKYQIIDNEVVMEAVFAASTGNIVVGNVSSLLLYASILGHRSFSIYNFLNELPSNPFENLDSFWSKVEKLA